MFADDFNFTLPKFYRQFLFKTNVLGVNTSD